jgi:hypothetical protein
MPKIINLSMQRTATQSFHEFAKAKGFSSKHFISDEEQKIFSKMSKKEMQMFYLSEIKKFDCVSDLPVPLFIKKIIEKNKDSKFLFIKRDAKDWAMSITKHQKQLKKQNTYPHLDQLTYSLFLGKQVSINGLTIDDYINIYKNYLSYSEELFKKNSLDIVRLKLEDSLSIPMNNLFDSVKKTEFVHFAKHDYLNDGRA